MHRVRACASIADFAPLLLFLGFEPLGRRWSWATWILDSALFSPACDGEMPGILRAGHSSVAGHGPALLRCVRQKRRG